MRKRRTYKRKVFTPEEDDFLRRNFPRKGRSWCAEKLKRSVGSIERRCMVLGLKFGDIPGMTGVRELAKIAGVSGTAVLKSARHHGVARYFGDTRKGKPTSSYIAMVPDEWATWYLERRKEWDEAEEVETYLTIREAAKLIGISPDTIRKALLGRGPLAEDISKMRMIEGQNKIQLFNPYDVAEVERKVRRMRDKARRMVSLKEVSAAYDIPNSTVLGRAKRRGVPIHMALVKGKWTSFVPPESVSIITGERGEEAA